MTRIAIIIIALLLAATTAAAASAHWIQPPKPLTQMTDQARARWLQHVRAHYRYVANHGRGKPRVSHAHAAKWVARQLAELRVEMMSPHYAICRVFGRYCSQALRVAYCETGGTYSVNATNGQYVNLFQMGYNERRTYGWHVAGSPAIVAARAAYRYFADSGYDWSPWECKP